MNGKMFKVLVPIERDGKKHWARLGTAFTNRDESINCYIEALPLSVFSGKELVVQIREYSDEDLRRRDEFRSRGSSNGNGDGHLHPSFYAPPPSPMEGVSGDPPF